MKAPTKSRSIKATNLAECRAREYRKSVPIAHAAPSTDTTKSTRIERGVRKLRSSNQETNQASMPSVGINVTIWKMRQKTNESPEMDIVVVLAICRRWLESNCAEQSRCYNL